MLGMWSRAFGQSICLAAAMHCAAGGMESDDAKAAFLLRFTSYVTWPGDGATGTDIAVLGAPQTADRLRALAETRGAQRPLRVRSITRLDEARDARILYVGNGQRVDSEALLRLSQGRGMLVVTDSGHGLAAGGAINFVDVDQRVRFEVSLDAARRADVHISAELLASAARVQGGKARPP